MTAVFTAIYCTGCQKEVDARLTDGGERYPHRPDLASLPFWRCDGCGNYVGCHHKTKDRARPLGVIATPEIVAWRKRIHAQLDPLWKHRLISRKEAYRYLSRGLGYEYHTGELRTVAECQRVLALVNQLSDTFVAWEEI